MPELQINHNQRGKHKMSYGKIFSSTFTGSMVGAGSDVFAVWSYVISNTIQGQVELNPVLLSAIIGCPKDRIVAAIEFLCKPDPDSRNKESDGARLVKEGQFAYLVVSHFIYRSMQDEDERREYNRIKKRESREKLCKNANKNGIVIDSQKMSAQAEAGSISKKQEADTLKTPLPPKGALQMRAEKIFKRRSETPLTASERRAFQKNKAAITATTEQDWKLLEAFYAAPQSETYSRKDLATLVNNWNGEIDRAKAWKNKSTPQPVQQNGY